MHQKGAGVTIGIHYQFMRIFRLYNKETGLYSKGGSYSYYHNYGWSAKGKLWTAEGYLKNHLKLAMRTNSGAPLPETWYVQEYILGEAGYLEYAAQLLADRPSKR